MDNGEGMRCGERCTLSKTNEAQTCAPKTSNTLYVNIKKKKISPIKTGSNFTVIYMVFLETSQP